MAKPLHGVALIRHSTSPMTLDGEFYAVFLKGRMSDIRFDTWISAYRHFIVCEDMDQAA
jgi:hypothetical protein